MKKTGELNIISALILRSAQTQTRINIYINKFNGEIMELQVLGSVAVPASETGLQVVVFPIVVVVVAAGKCRTN